MEMKMEMEKKLTNIGLVAILVIGVFAAVTGIASADTYYNETGNYIEGINVSVNTSEYFNRSDINVPLTFQINNTLNESATSFNVTNQSGLTTNATGILSANDSFWVNATEADTYWVNVSNNDNQWEYVNFTVEYSAPPPEITTNTIEIKPETLNLGSKGVFTAFITNVNVTAINVSTVVCEEAPAVRGMASEDDNGTYIVKFNRQDLVNVTKGDNVTLNVTGALYDGTLFGGNDTIRVINRGRWGLTESVPGQWLSEVKKWAKKVHKKFSAFDDDAIAIPGNPGKATARVFVSGNPASTSIVKNTFAVQHEFEDGFTVAVSAKGLAALEKIPGIELKPVPLYHVLGKPVCGDGNAHPSEQCGEPGLPECLPGYVCENCKCVESGGGEEPTPPERACYPSVQKPWGIVKVNGGSGGAEVKVAVLDTGVYEDHLDLKANIVDCKDTTKRGIRKGCADNNGHGTHVAGTIAANSGTDGKGIYGVAPNASLMAIKVCGPGGCWCDDIAAGIRYAADNGANIISMSLGGDTQSRLIKDAIDYAVGKGVLVVAAAGNDGPADGSIDYPGANVKVIAVGAIDSVENVSSWSSRGINDGDYIIEEGEVEFGAPGVAVESTWKDGCYYTAKGTSMATPHVTGLAAKLWQGNAAATRTHLQSIAKDIWAAGDDTATGFGLSIAP